MPPREPSHRPRKTGARPSSSSRARRADSDDSDDSGAGADNAPTTNTSSEAVAAFLATQPFTLDPFQIEAVEHLAAGRSVLVAAPTGNGKTIVAEFAIWQARQAGQRAIYTAPIKALSNQKFRDLRKRHGVREVGLLTGDIVENPAAPIVVMTTEIYRNMLLEGARAARMTVTEEASALVDPLRARNARDSHGSRDGQSSRDASDVAEMARRAAIDEELSGVGCVIFDELHFLSDPERG